MAQDTQMTIMQTPLEKMVSSILPPDVLQQLNDPRLTEACGKLQLLVEERGLDSATKALTRMATECAGPFVLDQGLDAFIDMCDKVKTAQGSFDLQCCCCGKKSPCDGCVQIKRLSCCI